MNIIGGGNPQDLNNIINYFEKNNDDLLDMKDIPLGLEIKPLEDSVEITMLFVDRNNLDENSPDVVLCDREEYIDQNRSELGADPYKGLADKIKKGSVLSIPASKPTEKGPLDIYSADEVPDKISGKILKIKMKEGGGTKIYTFRPDEFNVVRLTPDQYLRITNVVLRSLNDLSADLIENKHRIKNMNRLNLSVLRGRARLIGGLLDDFLKDFIENLSMKNRNNERRKSDRMKEIEEEQKSIEVKDRIKRKKREADKKHELKLDYELRSDILKDEQKKEIKKR